MVLVISKSGLINYYQAKHFTLVDPWQSSIPLLVYARCPPLPSQPDMCQISLNTQSQRTLWSSCASDFQKSLLPITLFRALPSATMTLPIIIQPVPPSIPPPHTSSLLLLFFFWTTLPSYSVKKTTTKRLIALEIKLRQQQRRRKKILFPSPTILLLQVLNFWLNPIPRKKYN